MMRETGLYLVYDVLAQDVITFMPCPSDNAAIIGFFNAKKSFEEKGYNPRLVELYRVFTLLMDARPRGLGLELKSSRSELLCNLENAGREFDRITNELIEKDAVSIDELED